MKDLRAQTALDIQHPDIWHSQTGRWFFNNKGLVLDSVSTRVAFDAAPVAIALCDLAGRLVQANRALQELLRAESIESLIGQDLGFLCAPHFYLDFLDDLASDGVPRQQLCTITTRSPVKQRQVLCNTRRVDGEEHAPRWLIITISELSPQRSYASTLSNSADYSPIEQLAGIAYWQITLDKDVNVEDVPMNWSDGYTSLVNTRGAGQVTCLRDWLALASRIDRARLHISLLQLASDGQPHDIEYDLERRAGSTRRLRSRAWRVPHQRAAGGYVLMGMEQDITATHGPERQLQSSIQTFKSLFDTNDFVACVVDQQLRLMYSNPAFQTLVSKHLGRPATAGLKLRELFASQKMRRSVIENMRQALSGEHRVQTIQFVDATNIRHNFDLGFNPIIGKNGETLGVSMSGYELKSTRIAAGRSSAD